MTEYQGDHLYDANLQTSATYAPDAKVADLLFAMARAADKADYRVRDLRSLFFTQEYMGELGYQELRGRMTMILTRPALGAKTRIVSTGPGDNGGPR